MGVDFLRNTCVSGPLSDVLSFSRQSVGLWKVRVDGALGVRHARLSGAARPACALMTRISHFNPVRRVPVPSGRNIRRHSTRFTLSVLPAEVCPSGAGRT